MKLALIVHKITRRTQGLELEPLTSCLLVASSITVPQRFTFLRNRTLYKSDCNIAFHKNFAFLSIDHTSFCIEFSVELSKFCVEFSLDVIQFCSFLLYFFLFSCFSSFSCTQPVSDFLTIRKKTVPAYLISSSNQRLPRIPPHTPPCTPTLTYPPNATHRPHVTPPPPSRTPIYPTQQTHIPPSANPPNPPYPPSPQHGSPNLNPPATRTTNIPSHLPPSPHVPHVCEVYAKFSAKYVRCTLVSTQNV